MADLEQLLIREAFAGNKEGVGTLLEKGAPVDSLNVDSIAQDTALMLCAANGHLDVVRLLAAKGANIHRQNANGFTPLLLAAINAHLPVCLFLISLGADPTAEDGFKRTALTNYGQSCSSDDILLQPSFSSAFIEYGRTALRDVRVAYLQGLPNPPPTTIVASLLFSDAFSDLVFVCPGGERIHAHRNIVAACSPHMNALLQGLWAENADERVAEVAMPQSAESVRALLRFMYTSEVDAAACTSHTMDVLDLASQHEQPYLKAACLNHLGGTLQSKNLLPIFEIALMYDFAALKADCIVFVQQHFADLSLNELIQFADEHNIPKLRDACDRGFVAILRIDNVVSYLEAALIFDLPVLKAGCERGVAAALTTANVVSFLEDALRHDMPVLKQACIDFVQKNVAQLNLSDIVKFADENGVAELKAASERGVISILSCDNALVYLMLAVNLDLPLLKASCVAFVHYNVAQFKASRVVQLADSFSIPELRVACELGTAAILNTANAVSYLETAMNHDMPILKAGCLAFLSKHPDVVASQAFLDLTIVNHGLWDELYALGEEAQGLGPSRYR